MGPSDINTIVLALHGNPFADTGNPFASNHGEPVKLPKVEVPLSSEADALVARCLEVPRSCLAMKSKPGGATRLERDWEVNQFRKVALSSIASEAMSLDDRSFNYFETKVAGALLDAMIDIFGSVKGTHYIHNAPAPAQELAGIGASLAQGVVCVDVLHTLGSEFKERSDRLANVAANLDHDVRGHFTSIRVPVDFFLHNSKWAPGVQHALQFPLDHTAPFVTSLIKGMRSIALDSYAIAPCDPTRPLLMATGHNSHRFKYTLTSNNQSVVTYSQGHVDRNIRIHIHPNVTMCADSDAIALVLYNLVKNPIKLAHMSGTPYPSIDIECTPSSDGRSTCIYVRDTGLGVSYDQLKETFSQRARLRQQAGTPLSLAESCLLHELWTSHVPPVALSRLLLDRGASVGGGTGIGLALAHSIITEGHQGHIQIYDHPDRGAGVQVLLPNVGPEVSIEERLSITRASLEHQLATALR
jgi:hypothetical protein